MIDLTPLEVRKKKGDFRRAMRGYEPELVDDFLDLVADRLEQVVRENLQMQERLNRLEEQVREYRERERALTEALVTAQEMREEMRVQTTRESEISRREAEVAAEQILRTAQQQREREEDALRRLRARQEQLLASYRAFLERELAELAVVARSLEASAGQDTPPSAGARPSPLDSPADLGLDSLAMVIEEEVVEEEIVLDLRDEDVLEDPRIEVDETEPGRPQSGDRDDPLRFAFGDEDR